MKSILKKLFLLGAMVVAGCDGASCPSIAILIYNVTVFDAVDGTSLCSYSLYDHDRWSEVIEIKMCSLSFSLSDTSPNVGEITVSHLGYDTKTLNNVKHNRDRYRCFDRHTMTEDVKIYLDPSS